MTEILSPNAVDGGAASADRVVDHPAWPVLKQAVEALRPAQSKDGSIDFEADGASSRAAVDAELDRVVAAVEELAPCCRTTRSTSGPS